MNWRYIETELAQAILAKNIRRIGQITDWMRYEAQLNYDQQYAVARRLTGISDEDWDQLLYEVDTSASSDRS
jgi:hypothetical protein